MKKEYPILFSTPMVQAILEGRKTQTRRIVKPQPILDEDSGYVYDGKHRELYKNDIHHQDWRIAFTNDWCRYKVGDLLWVRESFRKYLHVDEDGFTNQNDTRIDFAADKNEAIPMSDADGFQMFNKKGEEVFVPWKPSIHMPKSDARIWIEIESIRVERAQDIREEDAQAEGVIKSTSDKYDRQLSARQSFETLWASINGEESWHANPWVWVVSFKVLSTTGKPENL